MAGLTGTAPDVAADLTLPTTTMETEEREIQDSSGETRHCHCGRADPAAPSAPPPQGSSVNATNGHGGPYASAAVSAARPVVLVRYRPGITGQTARIVHLVPAAHRRAGGRAQRIVRRAAEPP